MDEKTSRTAKAQFGVPGLDDILLGGLTRNHLYLMEGAPGSGKTTLGLQFLLEGKNAGEKGLYITLSETEQELRETAASHNWTIPENVDVFELVPPESSPRRAPLLPNVPSIVEAGYPAAEFSFWVGLSSPAKTPRDIVNKLHDATEKALSDPDTDAKLAKLGVDPERMSVEQFAKFVKDDIAATVQLAKDAHIEPAVD